MHVNDSKHTPSSYIHIKVVCTYYISMTRNSDFSQGVLLALADSVKMWEMKAK